MTLRRLLALAAAVAVLAPAQALAAAPWTSAPLAGAPSTAAPPLAVTGRGAPGLLVPGARDASGALTGPATTLVALDASGAPVARTPLDLEGSFLAPLGQTRLLVVGSTVVGGAADAETVWATGTPGALGRLHTLPDGPGRVPAAVATGADGTVVIVTRGSRDRVDRRTLGVWVRRPGRSTFRRKVAVQAPGPSPEAAVAVGAGGQVLLALASAGRVQAVHLGVTGHPGAVHDIGAGTQAHLQAAIDDAGRLTVAWTSQRVAEGDAAGPFTASFATAAPGGSFGPRRTLGTVDIAGTGRYVAEPGVTLVRTGPTSAQLSWTDWHGAHFAVRTLDLAEGHRSAVTTVSDPAVDTTLAAAAPGAIVLDVGRRGADPLPGTPVTLSVAVRGAAGFGVPEPVSAPGVEAPLTPSLVAAPKAFLLAYAQFDDNLIHVATRLR